MPPPAQKSNTRTRAPTRPKSTRSTRANPDIENEPAESAQSSKIKLRIPAKRPPSIQPSAPEEVIRSKKQKKTATPNPLVNVTDPTSAVLSPQYNDPWEPPYSVLESVAKSSRMSMPKPNAQEDSRLDSSKQHLALLDSPPPALPQDHSAPLERYTPSTPDIDPILVQMPCSTHLNPANAMHPSFSPSNAAAAEAEESDTFDDDIFKSASNVKSISAYTTVATHLESSTAHDQLDETSSEELPFKSPSMKLKSALQGMTYQKKSLASRQAPVLSQSSSTPKRLLFSNPPGSRHSTPLPPSSSTPLQVNIPSADSGVLPPRLRPAIPLNGSVRSGPSSKGRTSLFSVSSARQPSPSKSQSAHSKASHSTPIRRPLLVSNQNVPVPGPVVISSSTSISKPLFSSSASSLIHLQSPFSDHKTTSKFSSPQIQIDKRTSGLKATPIRTTERMPPPPPPPVLQSIPKALTDRTVQLETMIAHATNQITDLRQQLNDKDKAFVALEKEVTEYLKYIALELKEQSERLDMLEKQRVNEGNEDERASKPKVKPHDNVFNSGRGGET